MALERAERRHDAPRTRRGCKAALQLLLLLRRLVLDRLRGVGEGAANLPIGGAGLLGLVQVGERHAKLQQGIGSLLALLVLLVAFEKGLGRLGIVAANVIAFAQPVTGVIRQRIVGMAVEKLAEGDFRFGVARFLHQPEGLRILVPRRALCCACGLLRRWRSDGSRGCGSRRRRGCRQAGRHLAQHPWPAAIGAGHGGRQRWRLHGGRRRCRRCGRGGRAPCPLAQPIVDIGGHLIHPRFQLPHLEPQFLHLAGGGTQVQFQLVEAHGEPRHGGAIGGRSSRRHGLRQHPDLSFQAVQLAANRIEAGGQRLRRGGRRGSHRRRHRQRRARAEECPAARQSPTAGHRPGGGQPVRASSPHR